MAGAARESAFWPDWRRDRKYRLEPAPHVVRWTRRLAPRADDDTSVRSTIAPVRGAGAWPRSSSDAKPDASLPGTPPPENSEWQVPNPDNGTGKRGK